MPVTIRRATPDDAITLVEAVDDLLQELFGTEPVGASRAPAIRALLMRPGDFVAFLAEDNGRIVGALTLSTCFAVYADGAFGEIAELYVRPAWRSKQVGRILIDAAAQHGRAMRWKSLEVGAPPADSWSRTIAFYKAYGFQEIGPRLGLSLSAV